MTAFKAVTAASNTENNATEGWGLAYPAAGPGRMITRQHGGELIHRVRHVRREVLKGQFEELIGKDPQEMHVRSSTRTGCFVRLAFIYALFCTTCRKIILAMTGEEGRANDLSTTKMEKEAE